MLGALVGGGATLLADGAVGRRAPLKTAFNAGQLALSSGLTGLVFETLKAGHGHGLTTNALAYVVAGLVYSLVNSALAAGAISLQGQPFLRSWLLALSEGGIFYLTMAPLGILMANAYAQSPWALLFQYCSGRCQGFRSSCQAEDRDRQGPGRPREHHRQARSLHLQPAVASRTTPGV